MSMRMPVSLAARRAFCPFLPMASDSWLSGTITSADGLTLAVLGSMIATDDTLAGDSARATNVAGSCDHSMMSIFSPRSSRLMTWMRVPRRPTHAPIGSTSRFVGGHRDLRALAGFPRRRLDEHDAFLDLGDLRLEEPREIARMRPRA